MAFFKRKKEGDTAPESPGKLPKGPGCFLYVVIIGLIVIVAGIGAGLVYTMKKIDPDQVGLRVVYNGLGIWDTNPEHAKVLPAGWHPIVPYFHDLVVYQKNVQTFEMTSKSGAAKRDSQALEVKPSGGYQLNVDLTIFYIIAGYQAAQVYTSYKDDYAIKANGIGAVAPGIIAGKLNEIPTAADFFNSALVAQKLEEARQALNEHEQIGKKGIMVLNIVVRDVEYPPEFEAAILRKVFAGELNQVSASLDAAIAAKVAWRQTIGEEIGTPSAPAASSAAEQAPAPKQSFISVRGPGGKVYRCTEYTEAAKDGEMIILPSGNGLINGQEMFNALEKK